MTALRLPAIPDQRAVLASRVLALLGVAFAAVTAALDFTEVEFATPALLGLAMLAVALSAFALGARPVTQRAKGRHSTQALAEARFRRNIRLSIFTLALYALFVILTTLAGGTAVVAAGLGNFPLLASLAGRLEVYLALVTAAVSAGPLLAADIPVVAPLSARRIRLAVAAAGALLLAVVVGVAAAFLPAIPDAVGLLALLAAAVALFLVVRWNARLPELHHILEWMETDTRVRKSQLPRALVFIATGFAAAAALGAALGSAGLLPASVVDPLLALSVVAVLLASFGVSVVPVATNLEVGRDDLEAGRRRRHLLLKGGAWGLTLLSIVLGLVFVLALVGTAAGDGPLRDTAHSLALWRGALLALPLAASAATLVTRVYVRSERKYTEEVRAAASVFASGALVLVAFGLLLGQRLVEGAWVTDDAASLAFLAASVLTVLYVKTRSLLPSVLDMMKEERKKTLEAPPETKEAIRRKMVWTYVGSLAFVGAFLAFVAASFSGAVDFDVREGGTKRDATLLLWATGLILVLALVLYRYFQGARVDPTKMRKDEDIGKRRLTSEEFVRYVILGVSMSVAGVLLVLGVLTFAGKLTSFGPIRLDPRFGTDFVVFAILVGLGPYGWYHNRELKRITAIDQKFPEFLRDLAESQRAGMTLTAAVITASKGTYGALTWEIRKMAAQIEWGVSFTDALQRFAKRVRTPLIERTVSLIVQAAQAGGNVVDILTAAADDSREIQLILKERKSAMSIYVMIIYIAFAVFVGVIAILNAQFIPEVSKAVRSADGVSLGGLTFKAFDEAEFKMLFFHAAVVQGLGGGLVAGVMEGGKPVSGLKHAFIMIGIAYLLFRLVIGG